MLSLRLSCAFLSLRSRLYDVTCSFMVNLSSAFAHCHGDSTTLHPHRQASQELDRTRNIFFHVGDIIFDYQAYCITSELRGILTFHFITRPDSGSRPKPGENVLKKYNKVLQPTSSFETIILFFKTPYPYL